MRQLVALLALLLAVPPAQAQIGGLLNRAKKAAEDAVQREAPERPTPPVRSAQAPSTQHATTAVQQATSDDAPLAPTGPMPISPAGYAPGIDMTNWLTDLARMRPPATETTGPIAARAFSETQIIFPVADAAYQVVIRNASGEVMTWQDLDLDIDRELPAFGVLGLRNSPENRERPLFIPEAGAYRATITANGHEIGGVDFESFVETSDDPFDSRSIVFMRGPWEQLATLSYRDPDNGTPDQLRFNYWISPSLASEEKAEFHVAVFRGSERLTDERGTKHNTFASYAGWAPADAQFYKERYHLTLDDLSDGEYRIELFEEGRTPVRVFRFRMQGGQPVAHSRSALDYTPRADFLSPRHGTYDRNAGDIGGMQNLIWLEADQ